MATTEFSKLTKEQMEMWERALYSEITPILTGDFAKDYKTPKIRFGRLKRCIANLLYPVVRWCDPNWLDKDHYYYW